MAVYNGPRQYRPEYLSAIKGLEEYSDGIEVATQLVNDLGDLRSGRWRTYRYPEHEGMDDDKLRELLVADLKRRLARYFGSNED